MNANSRNEPGATLLRRARSAERGQILAFLAISAVAFIAIGALVLDLGAAYRGQRKAQSAADGSALAAAQMLPTSTAQASSASQAVAAKNLSDGTVSLSFASQYVPNDTAITKADTTTPSFLAKVLGFSIFQESRKGGRKSNQDRTSYAYTRDALLIVVADGMGGHLHGEVT